MKLTLLIMASSLLFAPRGNYVVERKKIIKRHLQPSSVSVKTLSRSNSVSINSSPKEFSDDPPSYSRLTFRKNSPDRGCLYILLTPLRFIKNKL